MPFTNTELHGFLDDELERAIARIRERLLELDRDLGALKEERDRRTQELQRRLDQNEYSGIPDEEFDV